MRIVFICLKSVDSSHTITNYHLCNFVKLLKFSIYRQSSMWIHHSNCNCVYKMNVSKQYTESYDPNYKFVSTLHHNFVLLTVAFSDFTNSKHNQKQTLTQLNTLHINCITQNCRHTMQFYRCKRNIQF